MMYDRSYLDADAVVSRVYRQLSLSELAVSMPFLMAHCPIVTFNRMTQYLILTCSCTFMDESLVPWLGSAIIQVYYGNK